MLKRKLAGIKVCRKPSNGKKIIHMQTFALENAVKERKKIA